MNSTPNPIRNYYIAYFDILGYKEFFKQQPEKVPELLNSIHEAMTRTKTHIGIANSSPLMREVANVQIHVKVFSDNILLCMDATDNPLEQIRLISFLQIVADIQRGFINDYNLFVRGGIRRGLLSFNEDYVFGQGLIDVVAMEESAKFPRIVIDPELIAFLQKNPFFSLEESSKATEIEKRIVDKKEVSPDEQAFYSKILYHSQIFTILQTAAALLTLQWPDGNWILCYLNKANATTLFGETAKSNLLQMIQTVSPSDYQLASLPSQDFDTILQHHKRIVEEQLKEYGSNADLASGDTKSAELKEKILRKYVWVMAYHNYACELYQKYEHKILTRCNCDMRFLKMTIEVLNDEAGI